MLPFFPTKPLLAVGLSLTFSALFGQSPDKSKLKNGDIIFHSSLSAQSKAIQLATKSKYSHCGMIYQKKGKMYVYEAVQPVKLTDFDAWVKRGENHAYAVKRLKNADKLLTTKVLENMKTLAEGMLGKNYDWAFGWSDDRIYCSELVWKIYKQATGLELGSPQKLKEFDLSNPIVQYKIQERYKGKIPLEETVISPARIFESSLLIEVK